MVQRIAGMAAARSAERAHPKSRATLAAGLALASLAQLAMAQATPPPPAAPPPASATPAPTVPAAPAPKLVPVEAIRDVGKVAKGERVKVDFELRNEGAAMLLIQNVQPTCGCTVASFDEKIAPGATGKIHAEIDTVDFSGPIAKTITVLSNDPLHPRLSLTIKARVEPQIYTSPGYARYVYVQNQPPATVKQWLWTDKVPGFKVISVRSPYKFIQASFRPATPEEVRAEAPDANQWIVETTIQPDAEVGALRDFLVVETNHPKQKELRLPITGFVRPLISVTPFVADFGELELTAASQDFSLVVAHFGDAPIEILKVTASVPGVEATVKPIDTGKRWEVRLTLTGKMPKGRVDAEIRIETTSTQQPVVQVPLRGTVS
jgi:hypothetical protein